MGFQIDLSQITLEEYQDRLSKQDLLPSRQVLLENLFENFQKIKAQEIQDLEELLVSMKTKNRLHDLGEFGEKQ